MDQPSSTSDIESAQATAANADSSPEVARDEECVSRMELRVYKAAKEGDTTVLGLHRERLSQIVTPTKNTVVHIYIACASPKNPANVDTVREILGMCPALLLQPNKRGDTILHVAARHGHADIVEHLIDDARARQEEACCQLLIRTTNNDKDTALHEAVRFNHLAVVDKLTRADPDALYSANVAGETPLYMAAERGYSDVVFQILETCTGPTYQGPDGRTALHAAVIYNDQQMTRKLLNYFTGERALTKVVDKQGWTPLHYAASFGHSSVVKQLLESDESAAYVRDKDDKRTALHVAASKGHLGVIKELISHCPDCCELVDKRHRNILHYATEKHHLKVQEFIRSDPWLSNVLLNGKDDDQNTPLHLLVASLYNNEATLRDMPIEESGFHFIHDARVDKMAFNKENLTAFDIIIATDTFSTAVEKKLKTIFERNGTRPGHRIGRNKDGDGRNIKGNKRSLMKELKQAHLVAATLIATLAFTAGTNESQKKLKQKYAPQIFAWANTAAMTLSISAVFLHFFVILTASERVIYRQFIWVLCLTMSALISMLVAFFCGQYTALPSGLGPVVSVGGIFLLLWLTIYSLVSFTRGSFSDRSKKPLRFVRRH